MRRCADLFHRRWAVPVIAELHRSSGAKFVTLANRLGVSRDALRQTLEELIERGLVIRNPGYGHPLRPEYILTEAGAAIAPSCLSLFRTLDELKAGDVALRKWSMPIVFALRTGAKRFSELKAALPGITPRALTQSLKELRDHGLVTRLVVDEYPPTSVYQITARSRALARWSFPGVGLPVDTEPLVLNPLDRPATLPVLRSAPDAGAAVPAPVGSASGPA
jgi:DNA-binding HxlR family transcriptional regulator